MGLVWYTVELIDDGWWIVIVWIVCVPGVLVYLLFCFTLEGVGAAGICVLSCVLYFSDVREGLDCC